MLKAEDVKLGMYVDPEDLWDIVGIMFILTDFTADLGKVVYKGEPNTEEAVRTSDEIVERNSGLCVVYKPCDLEED